MQVIENETKRKTLQTNCACCVHCVFSRMMKLTIEAERCRKAVLKLTSDRRRSDPLT